MRTASVGLGPDGYFTEIAEIPLRWILAGRAAEALMAATGHVLCCNLPGCAYRVRWGSRDEEYGLADRSLGHCAYTAGQWLGCLEFRHEIRKASIPVTTDWVQEHFPEVRADFGFLEDGPDAMTVTFGGLPRPGRDPTRSPDRRSAWPARRRTSTPRPAGGCRARPRPGWRSCRWTGRSRSRSASSGLGLEQTARLHATMPGGSARSRLFPTYYGETGCAGVRACRILGT